jgi:hypothetical protein
MLDIGISSSSMTDLQMGHMISYMRNLVLKSISSVIRSIEAEAQLWRPDLSGRGKMQGI